MVNDTHTRRRRRSCLLNSEVILKCLSDDDLFAYGQWVDSMTQTILMPCFEKKYAIRVSLTNSVHLFNFICLEKLAKSW